MLVANIIAVLIDDLHICKRIHTGARERYVGKLEAAFCTEMFILFLITADDYFAAVITDGFNELFARIKEDLYTP